MGFASGFQVGYGAVDKAFDEREKRKLREELKRAGALQQETITGGGLQRSQTPEELARAQEYTQNIAAQDAAAFGLSPTEQIQYRPQAPTAEQQVTPDSYSLGGLTRETPFTQPEITRARTEEMARVYEQQGMPEEAMRMRSLAQQQELTGLQLNQAQRRQVYDDALAEITKKEFKDPTERTAAILAATEAFDPALALDLANKYTQNELNKITLDAKKFETEYSKSRAKGVDSVISWYDSVNDGFTLRRDGNRIIQTDTNGNERVFAQGTDNEIMMRMDAIAKPGGFLELAKAEVDMDKSKAQTALAQAQAAAVPITAANAGLTQNIALADQYRKQIADIDKALLNYPENTPQYNALVAQRNQVNRALADVNRTLSPTGVTRQPASSAGGPNLEAARAAALSGVNPATNKPWTAQDKADYERIFKEPFPESGEKPAAPKPAAQGLTRPEPASPRMARAQSGRITRIPPAPPEEITTRGGVRKPNPEYAAWVKKYGSQVGLQ